MSDNSRRKLLKSIATGSGVIVAGKSLPEKWVSPVIDTVMLPAHAQTSPGGNPPGGGAPSPTTTAGGPTPTTTAGGPTPTTTPAATTTAAPAGSVRLTVSQDWTPPAGVTSVNVVIAGGGGGGGYDNSVGGGAAGDGGQGGLDNTTFTNFAVTFGQNYAVVVGGAGAAGTPGSLANRTGSPGGTSSFNGSGDATGGAGGIPDGTTGAAGAPAGAGGAGGAGGNNGAGGAGDPGWVTISWS